MKFASLVVALVSLPAVAAAGTPAVDFLCGVYTDGQIVDVVPSPEAPRLDRPVACVLHLHDPSAAVYQGTITTVRHLVNPDTGDHADFENTGTSGPVVHRRGADPVDLEVVMVPGQDDANGEVPFDACERFDIIGTLVGDAGQVWTQTLTVRQGCTPATTAAGREVAGRGTGVAAVDDLLTGTPGAWVGYAFPAGRDLVFALGGCLSTGAETECLAQVWNRKGKRLARTGATIADPMSEDESADYTELELARADLVRTVRGQDGWALTPHDLIGGAVRFDTIQIDWNPRRAQLTIKNAGRVWKKVKTPKLPRGSKVESATLFFQEGGDPVAGVLLITTTDADGAPNHDANLALVPLPPLANE